MITVADVMKLPSMYGATILAGHAGMSNPVESVTVLEYGWISYTINIQHLLSLVKLLNPRRIHRNVRL